MDYIIINGLKFPIYWDGKKWIVCNKPIRSVDLNAPKLDN